MVTDPKRREWLGCAPSPRFAPLIELSTNSLPSAYLKARGAADDLTIQRLVSEDFFHIAHALSLLFEHDANTILQDLLGDYFPLIAGQNHQIDHVGRELFGPLSFYLPLLEQIAPRLGLIYLSDLTFASTTVAEELQRRDPGLKGVTIARVYFQNLADSRTGCIELFQVFQHLKATQERISAKLDPIDHLAIRIDTLQAVQQIHHRIHELTSDRFRCNRKELSSNRRDRTIHTKALMRDAPQGPFHKILEFIYYGSRLED